MNRLRLPIRLGLRRRFRRHWRTLCRQSYELKEQLRGRLLEQLGVDAVPVFWWRDVVNFGDLITPMLLPHFGLRAFFAPPTRATLFSTGSILQFVPPDYRGYIVGSGLIMDVNVRPIPQARILGLRGRLTQRLLGVSTDVVLGDPGLLAVQLSGVTARPRHPLGIVPHHSEMAHPALHEFVARYPNEVIIIDPRQQPRVVFAAIAECAAVLSSSLHGLVTADALGIPNRRLTLSGALKGGSFKFHDYYSAYAGKVEQRDQAAPAPITLNPTLTLQNAIAATLPPSAQIPEVQANLARLFHDFAARYRDDAGRH